MNMSSGVGVGVTTSCSSSSSFAHKSQFHPSILTVTRNHNYPFHLSHPPISASRSTSSSPISLRICCSSPSGSPPSGESDNKTVLDAFFLGKALGEALTERIESTVGEVLSTIGRLQSEQQKQLQEFQEDVVERAKRGKEKAARESLQEQGRLIPSSTKADASVSNGFNSSPIVVDDQNGPDEDLSDKGINID